MGKKSIERLSEKMEVISDQLTPSDPSVAIDLDQYQVLLKALMLQKNHQNVMARSADWLQGKHTSSREEERDKYLREVSEWMSKMNSCFSGEQNFSFLKKMHFCFADDTATAIGFQNAEGLWLNARSTFVREPQSPVFTYVFFSFQVVH